jgi:LPS sulfotransferase NodH
MAVDRFILLGRPRTGSTFLQTLLDAHSQIRVFGELFAQYSLPGWGIEPALKSPQAIAMIKNEPIKFLEDYLFDELPRRLAASPFKPRLSVVGFKLFYDQAQENPWQIVWRWARQQKNLKIIHVKRRNILKAHLSQRRAHANRSWISTPLNPPAPGEDRTTSPLYLDYEECLHAFKFTHEQELFCDSLFSEHPKIDVIYENLADEWEEEITRVQKFLGVPCEPLRPFTRKQAQLPIAAEIVNYLELKDRFRGTAWESFFDE